MALSLSVSGFSISEIFWLILTLILKINSCIVTTHHNSLGVSSALLVVIVNYVLVWREIVTFTAAAEYSPSGRVIKGHICQNY